MAVEFKTPGGLIIPASAAVEVYEGKADRSIGATVRALSGGFGSATAGQSRFKDYTTFLKAIKIPWVYRCVMTICSSFAASEWDLMDGQTAITSPQNPFLQLMARPNPFESGYHFLERQQQYMEMLGETVISLENKDAQGRPRELYVLNPAFVTVIPDPQNYVKGYLYNPTGINLPGFKPIPYDPDEIVHIKTPNPMNPYRGFGPIEASAVVLDIIEAMQGHELGYYRSGGRIVGVLQTEDEVDDDEFEKIKTEWRAFSQDQASRLKTAILQAGLKYTPVAEGMRAINQTEINKEKRDTILATWGVPPTKLGILENAQYKLNDADQTFETETMMPKKKRFEDGIQPLVDLFDPGWRVEFERKNFEDDATRLNNARSMSQIYGAFTVNDMLLYCGYPERDGGDVVFVPSQMLPMKISDLEELADANVEEQTSPPEPAGGAPSGGPVMPPPTGSGSNNGIPGSGAQPRANPAEPAPKLTVVKAEDDVEVKSLKEAFIKGFQDKGVERGEDGLSEEQRVIAYDILRKQDAARLVAHKMARRHDVKAARPQRVSSRAPGLGAAKLAALRRVLQRATGTVAPQVKQAFRSQRRKALQEVDRLVTGYKRQPEKERRTWLEQELKQAVPDAPMKAVLDVFHREALTEGFRAGSRLLAGRHAHLLRQKLETEKEARGLETKAVDDSWSTSFPFLEDSFEKLGQRIVGIDDTTREKVADVLEEGLRRGYNALQLANGYDLENYAGVAGVFDQADDYRAEMIARTEARDIFELGSLTSYGLAEVPAVEAMDGDEFDEFCRTRDGQVYPMVPGTNEIDAPAEDLDEHPNGTLVWLPAQMALADTGFTVSDLIQ